MNNTKPTVLESEITAKAKEIHADAYPMSIGELMSLYRDAELDIHPEFQRFFRWTQLQKSKFIESILLGIPVPSIFVSQRDDGVWDVVDGVQRLSTIFEFVGILRDEDGETVPASTLVGTDYLPSLESKSWEQPARPKDEFSSSLRLDFKRQKVDLKIIKKESDPNTKYDLFERLNTLGSQLSDQEVRNCLLVMINRSFFQWLQKLAQNTHFQETIGLTDTALQQRYDMELVLRFLIFHSAPDRSLKSIKDVGDFITRNMRALAVDKTFDIQHQELVFDRTFEAIHNAIGEDAFRRQDGGRGRGGFLISIFEVLAIGLGANIAKNSVASINSSKLQAALKKLWREPGFGRYSASGVSASSRVPALIPLGRRLFDIL